MQNTGQIIRSKKTAKDRYTPISNDILQSNELTPEEKTILIYLLSLPSDWVILKKQLIEWANFGRDRFNKAWKSLHEKGYLLSIRIFNQNTGQFVGWNHIVYEIPVLEDNRDTENPKVGDSESREIRKSENQSIYKVINEQSNNSTKEIESVRTRTHTQFIPPTLEEIRLQFRELDAERFFNYYESNGWMVGKNKMKNWKAAAANWLNKDKANNTFVSRNIATLNDD
jgi:hypothetical protein